MRHSAIPTLELRFDDKAHEVSYRWAAQEKQFAMPVHVGSKDAWKIIHPTAAWQHMRTNLNRDAFDAATDLYYINVSKQ
jgi:hypothetical protein